MNLDPLILLTDIQLAGEDIQLFIKNMDVSTYAGDKLTQAAVERKFEIIGEAVNQLHKFSPELAEKIPQYRLVINFRNLLIHGYRHVETDLVWDYAENHLPQLCQKVQELLVELDSSKK